MQTSTVVLIIVLIVVAILAAFMGYTAVNQSMKFGNIKDWDLIRSTWASTHAPSSNTNSNPKADFVCPDGSQIELGKAYVYPGASCGQSTSTQSNDVNDITTDLQKLLNEKQNYTFDLSSSPLAKLANGGSCTDSSGKNDLMFHAVYACAVSKKS